MFGMIYLSKVYDRGNRFRSGGGFLLLRHRRMHHMGGDGLKGLTQEEKDAVLGAYFEEGMEIEEIAQRMELTGAQVTRVLGDEKLLEPYRRRSEAAKLRAQIRVNESAEEAVIRQAELLRKQETSESVSQRAAKDILDRAGVRVMKEDRGEITIRFIHGEPEIGMPERQEDACILT